MFRCGKIQRLEGRRRQFRPGALMGHPDVNPSCIVRGVRGGRVVVRVRVVAAGVARLVGVVSYHPPSLHTALLSFPPFPLRTHAHTDKHLLPHSNTHYYHPPPTDTTTIICCVKGGGEDNRGVHMCVCGEMIVVLCVCAFVCVCVRGEGRR